MFYKVISRIPSFLRSKKANVAILFGLSLIPIVLAVGIATDYGRALAVRSRMADAADAAALAVGSWPDLNEAQLKQKAQQFFDANYSSAQLGTAGKINVSALDNDIKVEVSGSVPTSFMRLVNISNIDVGASTVITRRQRNIELALVLDTTGSMGSGGKMNSMQYAAKKMIQDLFDGKNTSDTLKIGVVPFSGAVNIGSDKINSGWLDKGDYPSVSTITKEDLDYNNNQSPLDFFKKLKHERGGWDWAGCVRERAEPYELTDHAPTSSIKDTLFTPYLAPDEPDDDNDDGQNYSNDYIDDDNCGSGGGWGGWGRWGGWGGGGGGTPEECQRHAGKYVNPDSHGYSSGDGPNYNCPIRSVTALTNNRGHVTSAIEQLQPNGNTVIPAGLLWGWRLLSPGEPFDEGATYDDEKWVKAIVLLTDGENSISGGSNGHNESVYNAFGYAAEGHLGSTSGWQAEKTLDEKTAQVCSAIKAKGILIYTIGFQVYDQTTQNLLKNCATKPDMYYNSPSNSQLAGIFGDIAQGLSELRIAQ